MKRYIPLLLLPLLIGCPFRPDILDIKRGMLRPHINTSAFVSVWGYPEKTKSLSSIDDNPTMKIKWNRYGGSASQVNKRETLQIWEYERYGVSLMFDDNDELMDWQTDKTVAELKALSHQEQQP